MLKSNVAHLQKWTNQSIWKSALVIGMVNRFFSESKKNFGCLKKSERSNGKNWDVGSEIYISIRFRLISKLFRDTKEQECCWYLEQISASWDFVLKSVAKMLYGNFLVNEGIFKLVCHCESCRWSDICCASGIFMKNLWTVGLLLLLS